MDDAAAVRLSVLRRLLDRARDEVRGEEGLLALSAAINNERDLAILVELSNTALGLLEHSHSSAEAYRQWPGRDPVDQTRAELEVRQTKSVLRMLAKNGALPTRPLHDPRTPVPDEIIDRVRGRAPDHDASLAPSATAIGSGCLLPRVVAMLVMMSVRPSIRMGARIAKKARSHSNSAAPAHAARSVGCEQRSGEGRA